MKLKLLALACVLSVVVTISGCSGHKTTNPATISATETRFQVPADYTTYTDDVGLFAISYPQDWKVDLSVVDSPDVTSLLKDIQSGLADWKGNYVFFAGVPASAGYQPNVNISVTPIPSGFSAYDDLVTSEINGLKQLMPDFQQYSMVNTSVSGRRATIIECQGSFTSGELTAIGKVHDLFLMTLAGNTLWVVSCTSFGNIYDQWSSDFNNIVKSFKLTG